MTSATNQDAYGNAGWGPAGYGGPPNGGGGNPWGQGGPGWGPRPGWGHPGWGPPGWMPYGFHPWFSRPFGIAAMLLGFIFFWPVGLAILLFMLGTGRMGCGRWRRMNGFMGGFQGQGRNGGPNGNGGPGYGGGPGFGSFKAWMCGGGQQPAQPSSGNRAFDEYRTETLRRLEEEQKEFGDFLDRLRFARDKSEFDQFMAERRSRPPSPPEGGEQPAT